MSLFALPKRNKSLKLWRFCPLYILMVTRSLLCDSGRCATESTGETNASESFGVWSVLGWFVAHNDTCRSACFSRRKKGFRETDHDRCGKRLDVRREAHDGG